MWGKTRILFVACCMAIALSVHAQELSNNAQVALLTCSPGNELYARYGHTAIRILDEANDIDLVFNYGIFNFNTEHFYWKFVRGETWYELGAAPYWWFMREYELTHRTVYEQWLNFTPEQCQELWSKLMDNYQPQNRKYLYNFVFDNCATRPYYMINGIFTGNNANGSWSTYEGAEGMTYRRFIQRYTPKGSWADFGINLLFGPKADRMMHGEERLFLPEELMMYISQAQTDGQSFVRSEQIAPFTIQPVRWYETWYFGMALLFAALAALSVYDRRHGKRTRWVDYILYGLYALLIILVTFLTFFSCHPLVGFGWRLLIIPLIHLCARSIYYIRF